MTIKMKLYQASEHDNFPDQLDDLKLTGFTYLSGGGGGAYILEFSDQTKYVLKLGIHEAPEAFKQELLADVIYVKLNYPVPSFAIYNQLPETWAERLNLPPTTLFRLSHYVEPSLQSIPFEKIQKAYTKSFVLDAFLGNRDKAKEGNFVTDKDNNIWFTDNGGCFFFRARGANKYVEEELAVVSEIQTLRNPQYNEQSPKLYELITEEEIKIQVKELFRSIPLLFDTFAVMNNVLKFIHAKELFHWLEKRCHYLQTQYFPQSINAVALTDALATQSKPSAAGTLIYCRSSDNEYYLLLGKRMRHEWWCNLGGMAKKQEMFLYETAARETEEESMGLIRPWPLELRNQSSHDLYSENLIYRMYFMEVNPIPIEEFNNLLSESENQHQKEYTNFAWISLKDILFALEKNEKSIHEDQETITIDTIIDSTHQKLIVYPPFFHMLLEPAVQEQLSRLMKDQSLLFQHTHNLTQYSSSKGKWVNSAVKIDDLGDIVQVEIPSLEKYSQQIAITMTNKNILQEELSEKFSYKKNSLVQTEISRIYELSKLHLQIYLGHEYDNQSMQHNLENFYKKISFCQPINQDTWNAHQATFLQILGRESENPGYISFYTAMNAETAFIQDVITTLKKMLCFLSNNTNYHGYRLNCPFFQKFKDIEALIRYYSDNFSKPLNNYETNFSDMVISANLFLFGNAKNKTSATFFYFLENRSFKPPDKENFLRDVLSKFGIYLDISYLNNLFKQIEQTKGRLYQIQISEDVVNNVAYPAGHFGAYNPLQCEVTSFQKLTDVIQLIQTSPQKHADYMNDLQVRLFAKPEIFDNPTLIKTHVYYAHPLSDADLSRYYQQLTIFILNAVVQFLREKTTAPSLFFVPTPMQQRFMEIQSICTGIQQDLLSALSPLTQMILDQNNHDVKIILENDATLDLLETIIHPMTKKETYLYEIAREIQDAEVQVLLLKYIAKNNKEKLSLLYSNQNKDNWEIAGIPRLLVAYLFSMDITTFEETIVPYLLLAQYIGAGNIEKIQELLANHRSSLKNYLFLNDVKIPHPRETKDVYIYALAREGKNFDIQLLLLKYLIECNWTSNNMLFGIMFSYHYQMHQNEWHTFGFPNILLQQILPPRNCSFTDFSTTVVPLLQLAQAIQEKNIEKVNKILTDHHDLSMSISIPHPTEDKNVYILEMINELRNIELYLQLSDQFTALDQKIMLKLPFKK